jgi:hypothetical protein
MHHTRSANPDVTLDVKANEWLEAPRGPQKLA